LSETHSLDGALYASNPYGVTNVVLVLQQDEKPIDEIVHQGLRAKADREACNSGTGQHGTKIQAQKGKHFQRCDKEHHENADAGDYAGNRPDLLNAHAGRKFANVQVGGLAAIARRIRVST